MHATAASRQSPQDAPGSWLRKARSQPSQVTRGAGPGGRDSSAERDGGRR